MQDATATPSARNAASAAASGSADRADSTRQQPSAAKALAVARPIPRLEPVIRATLSFSFRSITRLRSACPERAAIVAMQASPDIGAFLAYPPEYTFLGGHLKYRIIPSKVGERIWGNDGMRRSLA